RPGTHEVGDGAALAVVRAIAAAQEHAPIVAEVRHGVFFTTRRRRRQPCSLDPCWEARQLGVPAREKRSAPLAHPAAAELGLAGRGFPISQWWPNGSTTRPRRQPC